MPLFLETIFIPDLLACSATPSPVMNHCAHGYLGQQMVDKKHTLI